MSSLCCSRRGKRRKHEHGNSFTAFFRLLKFQLRWSEKTNFLVYLVSALAGQCFFRLSLGMALSLLAVNKVQPFGLDLSIDEEANGTSQDLLGLGMAVRVT